MFGVLVIKLWKFGWYVLDMGEIVFDDVMVLVGNLLGYEGVGFFYIMQYFVLECLIMVIGGVVLVEYVLEVVLKYMFE